MTVNIFRPEGKVYLKKDLLDLKINPDYENDQLTLPMIIKASPQTEYHPNKEDNLSYIIDLEKNLTTLPLKTNKKTIILETSITINEKTTLQRINTYKFIVLMVKQIESKHLLKFKSKIKKKANEFIRIGFKITESIASLYLLKDLLTKDIKNNKEKAQYLDEYINSIENMVKVLEDLEKFY